jgi:hypothetical protein
VEPGKLICPENPVKLGTWVLGGKFAGGVGRVADPTAAKFAVINLGPRSSGKGEFEPFQAVGA